MMNLSFPQQTPFQGFSPQSANVRMIQMLPQPQPSPAPSALGVKDWYLASLKFDALDNSKIDGSIFDPRPLPQPVPGPQPLPQPLPMTIPMSGGSPWGGSGVQGLNPMGGLTMGQQPMSGGFSASPFSGGVPMAGIPMTPASPFGSSMSSPFGAPMGNPTGSPMGGLIPNAMPTSSMPGAIPGMMPSSSPFGPSMPFGGNFGSNPLPPSGYPGGLPGSLPGGYPSLPGLPGQAPPSQGLPGLPGSSPAGDQGLVGMVMTLLTEILGLLTQITGKGKGGLFGSGNSNGNTSGRVEREAMKTAVQEFMRNQSSAATANTQGQSMPDALKRYLSSRFPSASDWKVELPYIRYRDADGSEQTVNMKDLMNGTDSANGSSTVIPAPNVTTTAKTNTSASSKAKAAAKTTGKTTVRR